MERCMECSIECGALINGRGQLPWRLSKRCPCMTLAFTSTAPISSGGEHIRLAHTHGEVGGGTALNNTRRYKQLLCCPCKVWQGVDTRSEHWISFLTRS